MGAREEASRLLSIIDSGQDPRRRKAEIAAADAANRAKQLTEAVTVREAWKDYLEDRKPHWGPRHYKDHLAMAQEGGVQRKRSPLKTKPSTR